MEEKKFRNEDIFAKHTSYALHDVKVVTPEEAYSLTRHYMKHFGLPQNPSQNGMYKRAYHLVLEAFDNKNLKAEEYMLIFTNRLHEFFEEYPKEYFLVERTRLIIVWMYYTEDNFIERLRKYFDDYCSTLK
jgi:hypothetical protein